MAKVVITAKVADVEQWEAGFRKVGELLGKVYMSPVKIGSNAHDNTIAFLAEVKDMDTFLSIIDSNEAKKAQAENGVIDGTHQYFLLDREFAF